MANNGTDIQFIRDPNTGASHPRGVYGNADKSEAQMFLVMTYAETVEFTASRRTRTARASF
jgi:hypothetical protein